MITHGYYFLTLHCNFLAHLGFFCWEESVFTIFAIRFLSGIIFNLVMAIVALMGLFGLEFALLRPAL